MYLVVSGTVRVTTYAASGRQTTFRDICAGDIFGELAAIDGHPRSADVVAVTDALLASMAPGVFWSVLREQPTVAERVLARMCGLVRQLSERLVDLSTLDVWDHHLAEHGAQLLRARLSLVEQLAPYLEDAYQQVSAGVGKAVPTPAGHLGELEPLALGIPVSETISSFRTISRSTSSSFGRSASVFISPYVAATDSAIVMRRSFIEKSPWQAR